MSVDARPRHPLFQKLSEDEHDRLLEVFVPFLQAQDPDRSVLDINQPGALALINETLQGCGLGTVSALIPEVLDTNLTSHIIGRETLLASLEAFWVTGHPSIPPGRSGVWVVFLWQGRSHHRQSSAASSAVQAKHVAAPRRTRRTSPFFIPYPKPKPQGRR